MLRAILPIAIGLSYFVSVYVCVEIWIVRRAWLSEYRGKIIDLIWVCTSAVSLAFLLLSLRETSLRDRMNTDEASSLEVRQAYVHKMQTGTEDCMAGIWPKGAIKGKSYSENGNLVTDACSGVSFLLNVAGRFFNDDNLWRDRPTLQNASEFSRVFDEVFGSGFSDIFAHGWTVHRPIDNLTFEAKTELSAWAKDVVAWKRDAAEANFEFKVVHAISGYGFLWPFALASALAFRLGKARADLIVARAKLKKAAVQETVSNLGGGMGQAENGRSREWDEVARHGGVDRERWLRLRIRSQRGR